MSSRRTIAVLAGVLVGVAAGGCCTSLQRANTIEREMKLQNRLRAEPAMLSAAGEIGAELLSIFPEEFPDCDRLGQSFPHARDCIQWNTSAYGKLVDARGVTHEVVPIHVPDWTYARLARRNNDLILLVPKVTRREVDRRTPCECDKVPRTAPPGSTRVVFMMREGGRLLSAQVEVPVTEDYVTLDCKGR
ncbi:MAG TPA: hypothetical protein VN903_18915 [Polyangia bacterium]|nr:hypothetical protein [Polyangia bacterium]